MDSPSPAPIVCVQNMQENRQQIEPLLLDRLAQSLGVLASQIDRDLDFTSLGVDSMEGVRLAVELEAAMGAQLPQTIFWDYPTVNELLDFLAETMKSMAASKLLQDVQQMSEADIAGLYEQMLTAEQDDVV